MQPQPPANLDPARINPVAAPKQCPCDSGKRYADCCGPLHSGKSLATNAEQLMRSRYAAFVLLLEPYLLQSWHPQTRPDGLKLDESPLPKWLGLKVVAHQVQDDTHQTVQFVARYKVGGRAYRLAELSRFERIDGRWYYLDGDVQG